MASSQMADGREAVSISQHSSLSQPQRATEQNVLSEEVTQRLGGG